MDNTLMIKTYLNTHPMVVRILSALCMFLVLGFSFYQGATAVLFLTIILNGCMIFEILSLKKTQSIGVKLLFSLYCTISVMCMFFIYKNIGPLYLLWAIGLVTFNDTAALFVGKTLQGPKLCPRISPGKTISGFVGGVLIGSLLSVYFAKWLGLDFPHHVIFVSLFLSFFSHMGDLLESAFKRYFNVKDSGHLIPGHGGVLDRMDSLLLVNIVLFFII